MPSFTDAATAYNLLLIRRSLDVVAELRDLWGAVRFGNLDKSWAKAKPQAVNLVVKAQLYGSASATAYHLNLLKASDLGPVTPTIRPLGFAGQSSGVLDLENVVDFAPIRTKQAIARGADEADALDAGFAQLSSIAESELQEAARGVTDVAMNATVDEQDEAIYRGYLRTPNPGACGRCLILANKFYRSDADFLRHPQCKCSHRPVLESEPNVNTPTTAELVDGLFDGELQRAFGKDGALAVNAGADPAQIVNARSGMSSAGDAYTRSGTTRRSFSGQRLRESGRRRRLSPAGCRIEAGGDRGIYRDLLFTNGYILEK